MFLKDIWPTRKELQDIERKYVIPAMFKETYSKITMGNTNWNSLEAPDSELYSWDEKSTYIKNPPFFNDLFLELPSIQSIENAYVLLYLGDSVTTGEFFIFI